MYAYLGTITSFEESEFIAVNFPTSEATGYFHSGTRATGADDWVYVINSPEANMPFYSMSNGRCRGWCNFPRMTNNVVNNHPTPEGTVLYRKSKVTTTLAAPTCPGYYLMEWGGSYSPVAPPIPQNGGLVPINKFVANQGNINWFMGTLKATLTYPGYNQVLIMSYVNSVPNFLFPASGTYPGLATLSFSDAGTGGGMRTDFIKLVSDLPYVTMIYPGSTGLTYGSRLTMTGGNFYTGNVFGFGMNPSNCTNAVITSTLVICDLPMTPSSTYAMYPLTIYTTKSSQSSNPPIYHAPTMRAIRVYQTVSSWTAVRNTIGVYPLIDGHKAWHGVVQSMAQRDFFRSAWPMSIDNPLWVGASGSFGNGIKANNLVGWSDGEVITNPNSWICVSTSFLCSVDGSIGGTSGVLNLGYDPNSGSAIFNMGTKLGGEIVFYGVNPINATNPVFQVATTGGSITFAVDGSAGFLYTTRSYTVNGQPGTSLVYLNRNQLQLDIPAGSGGGNRPIVVQIEGFKLYAEYVYKPSDIDSVTPVSANGGVITVSGQNFGSTLVQLIVKVGSVLCTDVQYITAHTQFFCTAPPGKGTNVILSVAVNGVATTKFINYIAPSITSIVQDGLTMIITGSSFGISNADISIYPPTCLYTSFTVINASSQVYVCTSSYAIGNAPVKVTLGGQTSAPYDFKWTPKLMSISPLNAAPSSRITINGQFLSLTTYTGAAAAVAIKIGANSCTDIALQSVGQSNYMTLLCTAPTALGSNLPLQVTIDTVSSGTLPITINMPTILSYIITNNKLSITATNVGTNSLDISVKINDILVPLDSLTPDSSNRILLVTIPDNTLNGNFYITEFNILSAPTAFQLTPMVTSFKDLSTDGGQITLYGRFFNTIDFASNTLALAVKIGGLPCTNPLATVNTALVCEQPFGTGVNRPVLVTSGTKTNSNTQFTVTYPLPSISSIVQQGMNVVINGADFGREQSVIVINLQGEIQQLTVGKIIFTMSDNALSGNINVVVNTQVSNVVPLYLVPILNSLANPATVGGSATIGGSLLSALRNDGSTNSLVINIDGTTPCPSPQFVSATKVKCQIPAGTGDYHSISAVIQGVASNAMAFSYAAPTLDTDISQTERLLSLSGSNLGTNKDMVSFVFGMYNVSVASVEESSATLYLPHFAQSGSAYLFVDNQPSNNVTILIRPVISTVKSVGVSGGDVIISGNFFNTQRLDGTSTPITVWMLNNAPCASPVKLADTAEESHITCKAPAGSGPSSVTVMIDGLSATYPMIYGAPTLSNITSSTANKFTIMGTNFGVDSNLIVVHWGDDITVATFTLTTDTIVFEPLSTYVNNYVYLTIAGQDTNKKFANLYPTVVSYSPLATSGGPVTISGSFVSPVNGDGSPSSIEVKFDDVLVDLISDVSKVIFKAPVGTGLDHSVTLSIGGLASLTSPKISYTAPHIQSNDQHGSSITLSGSNFGADTSKIQVPEGWTKTISSHSYAVFVIPLSYTNQLISISVDTQVSNDYQLDLVPVVLSTTSVPPTGGNIVLSGSYLNDKRMDGENTQLSVKVGGDVCVFVSTTGSKLTCTLTAGSYNGADIVVSVDTKTFTLAEGYSTSRPTIVTASSVVWNEPGKVSVVGTNFAPPLTIKIGQFVCTDIELISSTLATCVYDAEEEQDNQAFLVSVGSNGVVGSANVFLYNTNICPSDCATNGECQFGYCVCDSGFTGANCSIPVATDTHPVATYPTASSISFPINTDVNFIAALTHIREMNIGANVQRTLDLKDIKWIQSGATVADNTQSTSTYTGTFTGDSVTVTLVSTTYLAATTVSYAGETIPIAANTVKHTVSVESWTWASTDNTLQMIYTGTAPKTVSYNCTDEVVTSTFSAAGDFIIDSPIGVLFAQFTHRGHNDDNVVKLVVNPLANNDPLYTINDKQEIIHISVNLPSFDLITSFDPTFIAHQKPALSPAPSCIPATQSPTPTSNPSTTSPITTDNLSGSIQLVPTIITTITSIIIAMISL
eukprot:gene11608-13551_t